VLQGQGIALTTLESITKRYTWPKLYLEFLLLSAIRDPSWRRVRGFWLGLLGACRGSESHLAAGGCLWLCMGTAFERNDASTRKAGCNRCLLLCENSRECLGEAHVHGPALPGCTARHATAQHVRPFRLLLLVRKVGKPLFIVRSSATIRHCGRGATKLRVTLCPTLCRPCCVNTQGRRTLCFRWQWRRLRAGSWTSGDRWGRHYSSSAHPLMQWNPFCACTYRIVMACQQLDGCSTLPSATSS